MPDAGTARCAPMSRGMDEVGDAAKDCDTARFFHTPPKLR